MKNTITGILSIALIAAIVFGVITKNKLASARLQSSNEIDDLKASMTKTNAAFGNQIENLQSELDAANAYAQQVQTQLTDANAQIAKLQPEAARARTLPVFVTWRRAMLGNGGKVLVIHNTSGKALPLMIQAHNDTFGTKTFNHVANENSKIVTEIGVLQGWDFSAGDKVKISSAGFDAQIFTCP